MMKRILFITLGHLSGGEFTIAFEFCRRLSADQYAVCFLTSKSGERYLEQNNIRHVTLTQTETSQISEDRTRNRTIATQLIEEFQPDYFVVSDVYTMWYSYTWSGVDFAFLKDYQIPICSFDSYEFGSTDYVQDYYGGYKASLPPFIDQCDYVIRYCPINKIATPTEKVKYTYLFSRMPHQTEEQRREIKQRYGISETDKIIFMTNSNWESLNVNRLPALSNLLMWLPALLMNYCYELEDLINENITIVHVGSNTCERKENDSRTITYKHFEFLKPDEFDQLLGASDLYITTNIISSTLVKAVYSSVPSVVLQNDKLINFEKMKNGLMKMPAWYQKMASEVKIAYPFRLFPFGWHKFLGTVLQDNEYVETFEQLNLFQRNKVLKVIAGYLTDKERVDELRRKQQDYVEKISVLPSSDEVMASMGKENEILE